MPAGGDLYADPLHASALHYAINNCIMSLDL